MIDANVDHRETDKFDALASRWWDPDGEFRPLHDMNPLRVAYIEARCPVAGRAVLDIGCGGGILSEAIARNGATVTAIDMSDGPLAIAKAHAAESDLSIDYRKATAEMLADESPAQFDIVTCLELLEHVPDPASVVAACATLLRPGGSVFFSTINRNPKAWLLAVLGAEYVLRLLPAGTHEYERFIKPSELGRFSVAAGLAVREVSGMTYNPITRRFRLGDDVDVNYLMHAVRAAD